MPVKPGIGATHELCMVMSPTRAAGMPPIKTVAEALAIIPGPAGTHPGNIQGAVISPILAAG